VYRLLKAIALYQDVFAMIAMTILQAFKATMIDLDKVSSMANTTVPIEIARDHFAPDFRREGDFSVPASVWHNRYLLGNEIGRNLGIMSAVCLVFYALNRSGALEKLFRFLVTDGEMLFIGTMAYQFGCSAICQQMSVSPMVCN